MKWVSRGAVIWQFPLQRRSTSRMTKTPYYKTLSKPQTFVWRMFLFVALASFIAIILYNAIVVAFRSNPALNSVIIGTLGFGIIYTFQQVLRLYPEIRWVNNFRIADPGLAVERSPVMLAPMATLLRRRQGQAAISATAMRSILDSIGSRLDESRETTRYLVGLLVFLGLLGTFWGLMQTVQSVGLTINSLGGSRRRRGDVRGAEKRPGRAAEGHGRGLFVLAVRPCRIADRRLSRSAGLARRRRASTMSWRNGCPALPNSRPKAATVAAQPGPARAAPLRASRPAAQHDRSRREDRAGHGAQQ